jgi:hypothetical protein
VLHVELGGRRPAWDDYGVAPLLDAVGPGQVSINVHGGAAPTCRSAVTSGAASASEDGPWGLHGFTDLQVIARLAAALADSVQSSVVG